MIHYIYKIHFLCGFPSGRYYIGKRSFKGSDLSTDKYTGSGNFCFAYFKKYGVTEGITYIKEILEINPTKGINAIREGAIIGDLWKTDNLCMNQMPGGISIRKIEGKSIDECAELSPNQTPVKQYDLNGNFIKEWVSICEAETALGINNIGACCNHKRHRAGEWMWRYSKDNIECINPKELLPKHSRAIYQYSLDNVLLTKFDRIQDAVIKTGINKKVIQECCTGKRKSAKGFIWKYVDPTYIRKCNRDLAKCGAKMVIALDDNNNIINKFESINTAAKYFKVCTDTITKWEKCGKKIDNKYTLKIINYA